MWFSSDDTLSIINLKSYKESKINDFFTYSDRFGSVKGSPISVIRMAKPDTVIGLVCFKSKDFCLNCIYITDKYQEWLEIKKFIPDGKFTTQMCS